MALSLSKKKSLKTIRLSASNSSHFGKLSHQEGVRGVTFDGAYIILNRPKTPIRHLFSALGEVSVHLFSSYFYI